MDLHDAADAFVLGWTYTRRLSGAFEALPLDGATWLHDPTGRRMGELVGVDLSPERLVSLYPGGRGAISAMYSVGVDLDERKREFRALGWRLLRTEPAFVHLLVDLPPIDPCVVRVSSPEEVARVAKAAKMRLERMGVEDLDDATVRQYAASVEGEIVGWVRAVRAGRDSWVSSLNVAEAFRRRGLGAGLMARLLADDARLGRRGSVLLASHAGAQLYPRLGYEQVGTLMLLMPIKVR